MPSGWATSATPCPSDDPDRIVGPDGVTFERLVHPDKGIFKPDETSAELHLRLRTEELAGTDEDTDAAQRVAVAPSPWPVSTDLCTYRTLWRGIASSAHASSSS